MILHLCFESLCISLLSYAKQQRDMTKSHVFWLTCTAIANLSCLPFELNAVVTKLAGASFRPIGVLKRSTQLRHSRVKCKYIFV